MFRRRRSIIFTLLFAAFILITAGLLVRYPTVLSGVWHPQHMVQFTATGQIDFREEVSYWETRIAAVNGKAAYREFADSVSKLSNINQHNAAHAFGEALYRVEGIQGVGVCDDQFGGGCIHSLFGLTVQNYGITVGLKDLEAQCLSQPDIPNQRTCEHGLGHGIETYLGYAPENLADSLVTCGTLKDPTNLELGCYGGAFMEYNARTMVLTDGITARQLSSTDIYQPCSQIAKEYRGACMFWQPFWWQSSLKNEPIAAQYTTIGNYCAGASSLSATAVEDCFEGVGYDAAIVDNFNATTTAQACQSVSDTAADRLLCWSWGMPQLLRPAAKAVAARICAGLEGAQGIYCQQHDLDEVDLRKDPASLEDPQVL